MANQFFDFKQFRINQEKSAFKVGTDGVLLGAWATVQQGGRALDIGTGTGLLAIMVAQRSGMTVTAIEPDSLSAEEATENVKNCRWSKRIRVLNISLQDHTIPTGEKYNLIISNPPYFSDSVLNSDRRLSGARHNLTLGADEILSAASLMLADDGILSVILPYTEGNMFIATASGYGLYCNRMTRVKPLPSKGIKRLLMEFSGSKDQLKSDYLTIEKGDRHDYSTDYISLTKDFYLEF